jgi:hypothetical protein
MEPSLADVISIEFSVSYMVCKEALSMEKIFASGDDVKSDWNHLVWIAVLAYGIHRLASVYPLV